MYSVPFSVALEPVQPKPEWGQCRVAVYNGNRDKSLNSMDLTQSRTIKHRQNIKDTIQECTALPLSCGISSQYSVTLNDPMCACSTVCFNDFLFDLLFPGSKILPGKSITTHMHVLYMSECCCLFFSAAGNKLFYHMNTKRLHVYVGIKLFMQIGWSQRVGSINRDLDTNWNFTER